MLWATIIARATNENDCTANENRNLDPSERRIALDRHGRIAYVNFAASLEARKDVKLRYRRTNEDSWDEVYELDDVPQYFTDLRDRYVESEVEYRVQHDRWSDRVILEKLYFGLTFGMSGFPEHYYEGDNDDANDELKLEPLKLDREDGWDIFARDEDYCQWTGVTCVENKITELRLNNYDLKGTLTDDIQYLSDLEYFDLKGEYEADHCLITPGCSLTSPRSMLR